MPSRQASTGEVDEILLSPPTRTDEDGHRVIRGVLARYAVQLPRIDLSAARPHYQVPNPRRRCPRPCSPRMPSSAHSSAVTPPD
jgi:hypothetical protein